MCGYLSLCEYSKQLLIVPQPEVGLLLNWPGNVQQLSVSSWMNNSHMIYTVLQALQGGDSDFLFVKQLI